MAKPEARIRALEVVLLLGGLAMVGRAGYLQLVKGGDYARRAAAQRTERRVLEAPRGTIADRDGTVLATSLERYRIDVSAAQVRDRAELLRIYRTDVGAGLDRLRRALGRGDDFYAHGPFTAGQVRRLRTLRGVYLRPLYRREYPSGPLARPLIGTLSPDSARGASGLERFLDSLLSGTPGEAVLLKDARGRTYESPGRLARPSIRGHDVVLTIDRDLQEIAEGALAAAFEELEPDRGDILFLDPRTGEVLAAASREIDPAGRPMASASYFQGSFEPGSTAKLLTAATLLAHRKVGPRDAVSGEEGTWILAAEGGRDREIVDDHPAKGELTLARAIQVSSNVAMGKFSLRLTPAEHFDGLRAFGLGTPTGIEFPGEDGGRIPRPEQWRRGWEGVSAAMGYAITVTPLQLASAYAAIANGGVLMAPALIREIRRPDGKVVYRHRPLAIRQVVSTEVAEQLRGYLALSAADSGTGGRAQVKGGVLGKTGTARLVEGGRYVNRRAASFAGIYPAKDPQLVVVARIENPKGEYYGGLVAAPLVNRMLRQALAARQTALDRTRLAEERVERRRPAAPPESLAGPATSIGLPLPTAPPRQPGLVEVPDLAGQSVRAAAATLFRRGFQVRVEGGGLIQRTVPAAGDSLARGKTVTLIASRARPS